MSLLYLDVSMYPCEMAGWFVSSASAMQDALKAEISGHDVMENYDVHVPAGFLDTRRTQQTSDGHDADLPTSGIRAHASVPSRRKASREFGEQSNFKGQKLIRLRTRFSSS